MSRNAASLVTAVIMGPVVLLLNEILTGYHPTLGAVAAVPAAVCAGVCIAWLFNKSWPKT